MPLTGISCGSDAEALPVGDPRRLGSITGRRAEAALIAYYGLRQINGIARAA
jgi:hypothetical protein